MTNAKQEMLNFIGEDAVLCAYVDYDDGDGGHFEPVALKCGYTKDGWEGFLKALDFNYDNGYGAQMLYGKIWFKNGSWAERDEYDGSEWWAYRKRPDIPVALIADKVNEWGISQSESNEDLNP
jgi:hypothetical protein